MTRRPAQSARVGARRYLPVGPDGTQLARPSRHAVDAIVVAEAAGGRVEAADGQFGVVWDSRPPPEPGPVSRAGSDWRINTRGPRGAGWARTVQHGSREAA